MRSAEELLADGNVAAEAGDHDAALACFDELAAREDLVGGLALEALAGRATVLRSVKRYGEALAGWDEIVSQFGDLPDAETRVWVAWALLRKAATLRDSGSLEEARRTCEDVVARFDDDSDDRLRGYVSDAMGRQAIDLRNLGRHEDALRMRDLQLERYAVVEPPGRPRARLNAVEGRARALSALGRPGEAVAAWSERIAGMEGEGDLTSRKALAAALVGRAGDLRAIGEHEAALSDLDRLEAEFARDEDPSIARNLAYGLLEQAWNWQALGLARMARPALECLTTEFFSTSDAAIADAVTRGLAVRAGDCYEQSDHDRAESFADLAIERGSATTNEWLWDGVVAAAQTKALARSRREEVDAALALLDLWIKETVERFPGRPSCFATLLETKIVILGGHHRADEVIRLSYEIVERFGGSSDPALRRAVALALIERLPALGPLGRVEEVAAAMATLGEYEDETLAILDWQINGTDLEIAPRFAGYVAQRMLLRAGLLVQFDRDEEGEAAYGALIEKFKDSSDPDVRRIVAGALMTRTMLANADEDEDEDDD